MLEWELSRVRMVIYDVRGRLVSTLVDADWDPGNHSASWTGHGASGEKLDAGVYLLRFSAISRVSDRRMDSVRKLILSR